MEDTEECAPVTVEGPWTPAQVKTLKIKLQLYFQSKKKSGGGDCRVEAEDGAPRAEVYFSSAEVRERVLARQNHEIVLDGQTVKLRLSSGASPKNVTEVPVKPKDSTSKENEDEENEDKENEDGERFLSVGQSSKKLQKHKLRARQLEAAKSVRVENLPPTVISDMLGLYFEKKWTQPENIVMIPDDEAAIVTFKDPTVVKSICSRVDYSIASIPVKVYPYIESLGSALYGKERIPWKMPKPVTETVSHIIWKYLQEKKLIKSISDHMNQYFCNVNMDTPQAELSPLPNFLRQKGLTAKEVYAWGGSARDAFRQHMSQYTAFECPANEPAWKAAEAEVRSVTGGNVLLVFDKYRGVLTVAGGADDIKRIRAPVEKIVLKAVSQIKRQTNGVSDFVNLSPSMFFILQQLGLQKAAQDISPEMTLAYDENSQKLTIKGLFSEVSKTKTWILERNVAMSKKQINVPPGILDFLRSMDPMDMSNHLFTSQGISSIFRVESKGVLLMGSSDRALADAEGKMKEVLAVMDVDVEDQGVLKLQSWNDLKQELLGSYNFKKMKTVSIQAYPGREDKITVAGFQNPVKEVSRSLTDFIWSNSRTQENIRVKSVVVQFIEKKKTLEWSSIAKDNDLKVNLDPLKQRIFIEGSRFHVQKAKSCFKDLISSLFCDHLSVNKPGAKKYIQSQEYWFQAVLMNDFGCVVMLLDASENQAEEEENLEENNDESYCKVRTTAGVQVSVSKADICHFGVDAVVNAANEGLQHIGGLALAILKAAGPQLQQISNDYISKNGKLRPGEAIATDSCNLQCKYIVHAVGPRFSDTDRKTAVLRLKLAVTESLKQAEKKECTSIALPAISSGIFGFPVDLCAETIAQTVREYCDSPGNVRSLREIHLVDNNDNTVKVLASAVNKEFSDLGPTMMVPSQAGGKSLKAAGGYQHGRDRRGQRQPPGKHESSEREDHSGGRDAGESERGEYHSEELGAGETASGVQKDHRTKRGHSPSEHGRHGRTGRMEQTTAEGLKIVLLKGNIQDQTTHVIVNTIAEDMNLKQGAVSKAILQAAGPGLQTAIKSEAGVAVLGYGNVVTTDGFNLRCRKVFHVVCPRWDNGGGQAEETLVSITRYCLEEADKLKMGSLSFPAIGTGNLSFPRDVVSRVLLREIKTFSSRLSPQHLREVVIVVHPSDSQTVDCFTKAFSGQISQSTSEDEAFELTESPGGQFVGQSQQSSASFSQVSSLSVGVYQMQMGSLMLEVSSGDITKETCDAIVNSSNKTFDLRTGVSKAILDSAGPQVQMECEQQVSDPNYQPSLMILTSAGQLPSRNIIHVVGQNEPKHIKETVYSVLEVCDGRGFSSVAFPALGTGQGGADPSLVADAMVEAVVDFVREKHPKLVHSVKILIFQTSMVTEFHNSMKKKEGEEVEEKNIFSKFEDAVSDSLTSMLSGFEEQQSSSANLVLETEEFEPTEFDLCADNERAISLAKKKIEELILKEQAKKVIKDQYISQLSQGDMDELKDLQRNLTVSITLDRGQQGQEPTICLEGLTRDVLAAEMSIRAIFQKVERQVNLRSMLMSTVVQWQYQHQKGKMVAFDPLTNLKLEEAFKSQQTVQIQINNEAYNADAQLKKADSLTGQKMVQLLRKDLKEQAKKVIKDQYISQLSQEDMDKLKDLQRNLTVSITLDRGQQGQEPTICLQGLTRDVLAAEMSIRAIFQQVERQVNMKSMLMSTVVQWQFQHPNGKMEAFDPLTNLKLEEAFKNQQAVQIQINNEAYNTDAQLKKADSLTGQKMVQLLRKDLKEQAKKVIKDQYISQLSQGDMDELKDLQRNLTVSITLDRGQQGQEPTICLEGLTRDVLTAEVSIRSIFQRVERQVNLRNTALLMSAVVQWQYQRGDGTMVAFDPPTNLKLEEAYRNQRTVQIQINNELYNTDAQLKNAVSLRGQKMVLLRKDLKEDSSSSLPQHWDDMKDDLLKLIPLKPGDKEYSDVEILLKQTGLRTTIITIERVQNPTLWQSYQLKKQELEKKNKHKNNEKRLFHGTQAASTDLINHHGFNRSYAGKNAAMFGNGSYFAVDPCYSASGYAAPDSRGHKRMYLARVLVGDFTQGVKGMKAPPAKNSGNASDLYDSVTNNTANPSMFIVFNDMHAYPEYLITFT